MAATRIILACCLLAAPAAAQVSIAPGTPETVGRSGSLRGVVPGEAVPAPRGAMETFGLSRASKEAREKEGAPLKGANSFSRNEARRRIESNGFMEVSDLSKDKDGIWRGWAKRAGAPAGQTVKVYCDYQGNVGTS